MKKLLSLLVILLVSLVPYAALVESNGADIPETGKSFFFGRYEQDKNTQNGAEPIEWLVLSTENGKALLVSKYALDFRPLSEKRTEMKWISSDLRKWLNEDFFIKAFSESEQKAIILSEISNSISEGNREWDISEGESSSDRVFLPSYAEVMKYFSTKDARKLVATDYAREQNAKFLGFISIGAGETGWWIRSPGKVPHDATYIDVHGSSGSKAVSDKLGIRPALCLDMASNMSAFSYQQYALACQLAEKGEIEKAAKIFENLGNYYNSIELSREHRYQHALSALEAGEFDTAIELFVKLENYKESHQNGRISRYKKAVSYQEAGDYAQAIKLFGTVGQFQDSMTRMKQCYDKLGIPIYYFAAETLNTGVDTGYSKTNTIKGNDKHFGWELGRFFMSGFTRVSGETNINPIFIKTLGDSVSLWFELEQDIDKINGNDKLIIGEDANGYDQNFGVQKTNFGRGTLIIRHTNYQNEKAAPTIYTDYLLAKGTTAANTHVLLHEEGDYEVALDYELQDNAIAQITNKYANYRTWFRFSIRNGNCMVYPFDVVTGAELQNTAVAENGFSLDLARSRYLDIDVKRSVLVETNAGVVEDERFNRPAKDGEKYTDEGIYTITVSNRYTGETTTKTLFVGSEELLQKYIANGFSTERLK